MKKLIIGLLIVFSSVSLAKTRLKVGVLAPEGTNWAKNLKKMAKEIKKATDKEVRIKFYFGGTQGDEPDVLRKVRINQLQGGIFTGKTLGDINGDVRVMEIPFTFFDDREKALGTLLNLSSFFNKGFEKADMRNLGFFEIGIIYFVSQKPSPNLNSLKGMKIWSWEGDQLVAALIKEMNLVSVPLPLPDVLSSLSTGIVEAAYAPPLGILALQWNTKVKYLVDFPLSYSVGAFLLSKKAWESIPAKHRGTVEKIASKYITQVNSVNAKDNTDALAVMKTQGINFLDFPQADIAQGKQLRAKIVKELTGKLFSKEAVSKLEKSVGKTEPPKKKAAK